LILPLLDNILQLIDFQFLLIYKFLQFIIFFLDID
jgi:hypothetical protein